MTTKAHDMMTDERSLKRHNGSQQGHKDKPGRTT